MKPQKERCRLCGRILKPSKLERFKWKCKYCNRIFGKDELTVKRNWREEQTHNIDIPTEEKIYTP